MKFSDRLAVILDRAITFIAPLGCLFVVPALADAIAAFAL